MVLRLKVLRQQEQRINKIKEMMDNWYSIKVPSISYPTYEYQPIGGSNSYPAGPKVETTKRLFEMFGLAR